MKWCQLVGFFLRTWKQFQRQFKDDFLDSQGQPRDTWQGFGREQSSCRFRNVTVDVGSLHSGKPRQCLEKNKKTGTYLAHCSLLGQILRPPSISALVWHSGAPLWKSFRASGWWPRTIICLLAMGQTWSTDCQQFPREPTNLRSRFGWIWSWPHRRWHVVTSLEWWLGSGESFPTGFISDISELSESDNSAG